MNEPYIWPVTPNNTGLWKRENMKMGAGENCEKGEQWQILKDLLTVFYFGDLYRQLFSAFRWWVRVTLFFDFP